MDTESLAGICPHHATNLGELEIYLKHGGVVSRERLLAETGARIPHFKTDPGDLELGLLARTFGNFGDLGDVFARANPGNAAPLAYGPIQLCFDEGVWSELKDVVPTERTAPSYGERWRDSGITKEQLVELREADDSYRLDTIEFSSSSTLIPFSSLTRVVVENLMILGCPLVKLVKALFKSYQFELATTREEAVAGRPQIVRRRMELDRALLLQEVAALTEQVQADLNEGEALRFDRAPSKITDKVQKWETWATYFYSGSVQWFREKRPTLKNVPAFRKGAWPE